MRGEFGSEETLGCDFGCSGQPVADSGAKLCSWPKGLDGKALVYGATSVTAAIV